jgi:hypothetical protein
MAFVSTRIITDLRKVVMQRASSDVVKLTEYCLPYPLKYRLSMFLAGFIEDSVVYGQPDEITHFGHRKF